MIILFVAYVNHT